MSKSHSPPTGFVFFCLLQRCNDIMPLLLLLRERVNSHCLPGYKSLVRHPSVNAGCLRCLNEAQKLSISCSEYSTNGWVSEWLVSLVGHVWFFTICSWKTGVPPPSPPLLIPSAPLQPAVECTSPSPSTLRQIDCHLL